MGGFPETYDDPKFVTYTSQYRITGHKRETSAFETFYVGKFILSTQRINLICVSHPHQYSSTVSFRNSSVTAFAQGCNIC